MQEHLRNGSKNFFWIKILFSFKASRTLSENSQALKTIHHRFSTITIRSPFSFSLTQYHVLLITNNNKFSNLHTRLHIQIQIVNNLFNTNTQLNQQSSVTTTQNSKQYHELTLFSSPIKSAMLIFGLTDNSTLNSNQNRIKYKGGRTNRNKK